MNDPEEVTMGTDPTTPGDEQPAPGTDAAPGPETTPPGDTPPPEAPPAPDPDAPPAPVVTGTEPAPVTGGDPAPTTDEDTSEDEDYEPVETEAVVTDEDIVRQADGTAPGGHVQMTEGGVPRQAGDPNPELGMAPDAFPEPGETPAPPPDSSEPEQIDIDRPDVGTPVTDTPPEGSVTEEEGTTSEA